MKIKNTLRLIVMAALMLGVAVGCKKEPVNNDQKPVETPKPEDGNPIALEDFTVTLTTLHAGDVYLDIEPKDKEMNYFYSLLIKEEVPETDEELCAADLSYFNYVANEYGLTLSQLLSESLVKGDVEWRYNGLSPRTEYVLYMYGLDFNGTVLTTVNRLSFTTPAVKPVDCSFDIAIGDNVTAQSFSVTIVPSDDRVGYYFDVFPAAAYEEFCLSDPANIPAFIGEYIPAIASENGYSVPATVGLISNYGALTKDFTAEDGIQPSNTYYIFAIGLGADGTAVTEATVVSVTTARPPMNTFEVLQASVEDDRATFYVTPTQRESYVALFELQEYMYDASGNPLSDEEIIDAILAAQGDFIGNHMYAGTSSVSECPLIPNKDYYCLVFGYFGGEVTTPLTKVAFKTLEADAVDCDFVVTVGNPTTTTVNVSFDPYITPTPHMFNYMTYAKYEEYGANDEAIMRYNDELIDSMWDPSKMSREEWLSRALETEYNSWAIEGLEPNTRYLVYVIGLVPDGTYTTAPIIREFTTKEVKEGPQIKEVLYNYQRMDKAAAAWFYFDTDTDVALFKMSHLVEDRSVYDLSDAELIKYLDEENETTFVWEVSNQTYLTVFDKNIESGTTIYYAGAVYDSDGNYTIFRGENTYN